MSCDGVSESLSTSVSLDVYSVKFEGCKTIYPLRIIKPFNKYSIDDNEQLRLVLNDLHDNNCEITQYIADNPKRSNARQCLCFSSWHPCEYCFAKGTKLETNSLETKKKKEGLKMQKEIVAEKIERVRQTGSVNSSQMLKLKNIEKKLNVEEKKLKPKKSNIVWPKSTMSGPPRTRQEILNIIEKIENNQQMTSDESKGIVGRSLLFDFPGFNFVSDITVEYLHCVCLGVTKKCVELTFKVGENRPRITKRKLSLPSDFNLKIHSVKFPFEFNRRIRDLDFSVYKGQEFRNLLLFLFPLILDCIEPNEKERHMWLNLSYMIKACVIPSEEFRQLPDGLVETCMKSFYSLYEKLFGARNCTYNTHVVGSHLIEIRFHGPLTQTSAFPFESFYGEMRNSFVPGTPSTLKQIMQNVLIKRAISNHRCENSIYISPKETSQQANNLIYCFVNRSYVLYKVISVDGDSITCLNMETLPCIFPETPNLSWNLIGVFKQGNICNEPITINRSTVKGKVIKINEFLITCPINVLNEK